MRIGVLNVEVRADLRQCFRADRDIKAFRPFDLLPRALDVGVPLQSGQNRLLKGEARNDGAIHLDDVRAGQEQRMRKKGQDRENDQGVRKKFSHGKEERDGLNGWVSAKERQDREL